MLRYNFGDKDTPSFPDQESFFFTDGREMVCEMWLRCACSKLSGSPLVGTTEPLFLAKEF